MPANNSIYNPKNLPVEELPTIYGFNNGGPPDWLEGVVLAEDGTYLGSHICSNESYMPLDLGVLEDTRPDLHETFRVHYPEGYRMEFVPGSEVKSHPELCAAFTKNQQKQGVSS